MNRTHTQAANPLASRYPTVNSNDAIEWEEMPSIAPRMVQMDLRPATAKPVVMRTQATDFNTAWGVTMPAHLEPTSQPAAFHEAIRGLVTREVDEPELFKHFFG